MDDETVNEKSSATLRERKRGGGGGRWVEVELGGVWGSMSSATVVTVTQRLSKGSKSSSSPSSSSSSLFLHPYLLSSSLLTISQPFSLRV